MIFKTETFLRNNNLPRPLPHTHTHTYFLPTSGLINMSCIEDVYKLLKELIDALLYKFTLKIFNQYLVVCFFGRLWWKYMGCSGSTLSVFLLQPCWTSGEIWGCVSREYLIMGWDLKTRGTPSHKMARCLFPADSSPCWGLWNLPCCSQGPRRGLHRPGTSLCLNGHSLALEEKLPVC